MSLREKTISGAKWSAIATVIIIGLGLVQMTVLAEGTADANMLKYLGLTDKKKSVILSVVQQNKLPDALYALGRKFETVKDGKGIAFTIPLSSVMGALLYGFLSNNRSVVKEEK